MMTHELAMLSQRLDVHEKRLDVHRERLDMMHVRLLTCESKVDDVESDNEIAIEELNDRLLRFTEQVNEAIGLTTKFAKQVAELQGEVHATS